MKDDLVYLDHILECLTWIEQFTTDGREAFLHDRKTQSAVMRELQTLAESTQRLSEELRAKYPEVAWTAISGFRNVLVHGYLGIRLDRVWEIIERDLPGLRGAVEAMQKDA